MTAGIIVIVSAVLIFAYVVVSRLVRSTRRRRLLAAPFPREWEGIIERNVPICARLPEPLRKELKGRVNVFMAE
ncbi:MAG: hypothetical protein AMS16_04660, partial [Planctomycetes bacterium DG_58]